MNSLEFIIYIIFIISVFSFISLAPWIPTRWDDLERLNDILKLQKWEKFLEMWCWNAKVSFYLAKNNPETSIVWIELSPFFYIISKIRVYFSGIKNMNIIYGNALNLDLSEFDVIYVFWLPETVTKKVFPKLSKINNKNFRFISYCFKMTNDYFKEKKYKPSQKYAIYEYKL